jgi:putative addiction module killer protein
MGRSCAWRQAASLIIELVAKMYLFGYTSQMYQVQQTDIFEKWLSKLKDRRATAKVLVRIESLRQGNTGDSKSLGSGLHELRMHFGPGYRVYYTRKSGLVILLLCGGDKSSQSKDIARARKVLTELKAE